ncbi:hypothetical protein NSQ54_01970 [Alkalihalobacillus sp. FSL W8-0930]
MSETQTVDPLKKANQFSLYLAIILFLFSLGSVTWGLFGLPAIIYALVCIKKYEGDKKMLYISIILNAYSFYRFIYFYVEYFSNLN